MKNEKKGEEVFLVDGFKATVLIPENPNGKWLWKTEFFYAFDKAERKLYDKGYTRVNLEICDKYGSPDAVRLMYDFYLELMKRFDFLEKKGFLLGFSRGGLYAFNFALAHPECVCGVYFDAPVLDLNSWPRVQPEFNELELVSQVVKEYGLKDKEELLHFHNSPVDKLEAYFSLNIPTLLVAGTFDRTVAFKENSDIMIKYCLEHNKKLIYYAKVGADHHPHSFGNNVGKDMYGIPYPDHFKVYSSEIEGSAPDQLKEINSDEKLIMPFFDEN